MDIEINLTNFMLENLLSANTLYERLSMGYGSFWLNKLEEIIDHEVSSSAVSDDEFIAKGWALNPKDDSLEDRIEEKKIIEIKNYSRALKAIPESFTRPLDAELFNKFISIIHNSLPEEQSNLRITNEMVTRVLSDTGEIQEKRIRIKTDPEEIKLNLKKLIEYINTQLDVLNPFLLGGIVHLIIAKIHPYHDGNGRLARIFEKGIFHMKGYNYMLFMLEDYFLINNALYYELINKTIRENNLTEWLEFYSKGILFSIKQSEEILYFLSGGTIDLLNKLVIDTSERESQVLDLFNNLEQASAADIGKKLGITRQSANFLTKNLLKKKLIKKIGEGTSVRYRINFNRKPSLSIYKSE